MSAPRHVLENSPHRRQLAAGASLRRGGLARHSAGTWLMVVLVLVLDVLAASPAAHAWLHAHDHPAHACASHPHDADTPADDGAEQGCVVFRFASGHALVEAPAPLPQPGAPVLSPWRSLPAEPHCRAPRFLRPPGCGPP